MRTRTALIIAFIFTTTIMTTLLTATESSGSQRQSSVLHTLTRSHAFRAAVQAGAPQAPGPQDAVGYLYGPNSASYAKVGSRVRGASLRPGTKIVQEYATVGKRYLILSKRPVSSHGKLETITVISAPSPQLAAHTVVSTTPETTTTTAPVVAPTTTTTQPPAVTQAPTTVVSSSPPVSSSDDAIFNCIIAHESGGDPAAVNPSSGAGGLFQFLPSSWLAYGGGQFASLPNLATADQQWQIARAAKAESGWYPWVGTHCTPVG